LVNCMADEDLRFLSWCKRSSRFRHESATIGVNFNDPAYTSMDDDSEHFRYLCRIEDGIKSHALEFARRRGAEISLRITPDNGFDYFVDIIPRSMAHAYVEEAKRQFPYYSFMVTIDPRATPPAYAPAPEQEPEVQ